MNARVTMVGRLRTIAALTILASLLSLLSPIAVDAAPSPQPAQPGGQAIPAPWRSPRTVYIPETGQSLDGVFLDFWRANSGIGNFGYPITPEVVENGHTVQYFEYARFEYWPENAGSVVVLGNIGAELQPKLIVRSMFDGAKAVSVNREMAAIAQAWVPVEKKLAKKATTANSRYVAETGHTVNNGFKDFWEATGEAAYLGNPLTEEYRLNGTTYQVFERGQLAWKQNKNPWMVTLGPVLARKYGVTMAPSAQGNLPIYSEDLFIGPIGNGGEHWIEVSLSGQYMWAWEGDVAVWEGYVSTGRATFETPTGTFFINNKLESQTMEGVIGGEEYRVPDVPWVMYFTDQGHAIHGTYWHNNFGTPMSHGCINLPMDVAAWIYTWAGYGARVVIHN